MADICSVFIACGASTEAVVNTEGVTPLLLAARFGHIG